MHIRTNRRRAKKRTVRPSWNKPEQSLFLGRTLIKVFRQPSRNQVLVLDAFEEQGWPRRIDDPLPPSGSTDPRDRLHDTIKNLNRHQRARLIRFRGDGRGQGVLWEVAARR